MVTFPKDFEKTEYFVYLSLFFIFKLINYYNISISIIALILVKF